MKYVYLIHKSQGSWDDYYRRVIEVWSNAQDAEYRVAELTAKEMAHWYRGCQLQDIPNEEWEKLGEEDLELYNNVQSHEAPAKYDVEEMEILTKL